MAIGILVAEGIIAQETAQQYVLVGELSLDGRIKPIRGDCPSACCVATNTR